MDRLCGDSLIWQSIEAICGIHAQRQRWQHSIVDPTEEYTQLQAKWQKQLVSDQYDPNDPTIVDYIQTITADAMALYQTMAQSEDRTTLWPLEQGNTPSADLTTQFTKLQKIALAYGTKGSSLYQDPTVAATIIDGLDFMVTKKGYDGKNTMETGGIGKSGSRKS